MVCPVCIVVAPAIIVSEILGIPDEITAFLIGIFTLSITIITIKWIKGRFKVEKISKLTFILLLILYSTISIWTMKIFGLW